MSCQSAPVATPRMARRVVWGLSDTIATLAPDDRVGQGRLADVGTPGEGDEPRAGADPLKGGITRFGTTMGLALAHPPHELGLEGQHLAVVGLVIHAAEVQGAVDHGLAEVLGARRADDDVSELARADAVTVLVDAEGEHVGGTVDPAMLAIERADPVLVHELDRHVTLIDPGGREGERAQLLQLDRGRTLGDDRVDPDHLNVEHGRGPAPLRALSRVQLRCEPLGVLVVGGDDPAHELVADHVLLTEADEVDALHRLEDLRNDDQARILFARQVDLGDVAGDDHLGVEAQPGQEHLHLLRAGVLGLVEDDEAVVEGATAHEGQRRHLDHAALQMLGDPLGIEHVVQRVEQRAQVGIDLGHQVARQEAQALAGLDRGAGEDDPVDLAAAERGGGQSHGQEGLARAGRADPEGDRVLADRVHVALLVDGLGGDLGRAVAPDDVLEDPRGRLVLIQGPAHRLDRAGRDLVALLDQLGELVHHDCGGIDRLRLRLRGSACCRADRHRSPGVTPACAGRRPRCRPARRQRRCRARELCALRVPPSSECLAHARRSALAVGATAGGGHDRLHDLTHVAGAAGAGVGDGASHERVEFSVIELGRHVGRDQLRLGFLGDGKLGPASVAKLRRRLEPALALSAQYGQFIVAAVLGRASGVRREPAAARPRALSRPPSWRWSCPTLTCSATVTTDQG